jgi:hypothetical protein
LKASENRYTSPEQQRRRGRYIGLRPRLRISQFVEPRRRRLVDLVPRGQSLTGIFSLGRDALRYLALTQVIPRGAEVWLPAYSCAQLVESFEGVGIKLHCYDVRPNLAVDWDPLVRARRRVTGSHCLVLVDYFGYPQTLAQDAADNLRDLFDVVVRDAAHSIPLTGLPVVQGREAGYVVYSLRKPLAVPELALLTSDQAIDPGRSDRFVAGRRPLARRLFTGVETGGLVIQALRRIPTFRRLRQRLKVAYGRGIPPSRFAVGLVERMNLEHVVAARRRVAARLSLAIGPAAIFRTVPEDACPYYFPILSRRPDQLRTDLAGRGIETTRFWSIDESLLDDQHGGTRRIAREMVCLPTHHDLTEAETDVLVAAATDCVA